MAKITLLLDEDVRPILGEILRQRGCDAVHVLDAGRTGQSDAEQPGLCRQPTAHNPHS